MAEPATIKLSQVRDYQFEVDFGRPGMPMLRTDEPPPVGADLGPDPASMLVAAVANCLSASLLFAMRKFHNEPGPLSVRAHAVPTRNERNRLRIGEIVVAIRLGRDTGAMSSVDRVFSQFEDFCTVTQSVRGAIRVRVQVESVNGALLYESDGTDAQA